MPLLALIEKYSGTVFGILIAVLLLWEGLRPAHKPADALIRRWITNAALFLTGRAASAFLIGTTSVTAAAVASAFRTGPLHSDALPFWVRFGLGVLALDLLAYGRHWLLHASGWLWKIHRTHHSDEGYDVTTGLRFHPVETLLVIWTNLALIYVLVPPPASVIAFEFLALVVNLIVHGNICLPGDRLIRWILITPGVHYIHHSDHPADMRSNYGTVFPFWDRLFRTFADHSSVAATAEPPTRNPATEAA